VSETYTDWHLVVTSDDDAGEPTAWKHTQSHTISVRLAEAGQTRLVISGDPEHLAKFLCAAAARVLEVAATMGTTQPKPTWTIGDQP